MNLFQDLPFFCKSIAIPTCPPFQLPTIPTTLTKYSPTLCPSPPPLPFNERSACFASALSHPLFVGRASMCAYTLSHPHHSSPHTNILASLSKVRCCRPKKFGRLPEGLPHRPSPSPQPSQNHIRPSPLATALGSLVKGSWIATRLFLTINCNILRFHQH